MQTRGRVEGIEAVQWKFAPRPGGDPRFFYPVAESARLEPRGKADGWEPEVEGGDESFSGYIVQLVPLD